MHLRFIAPRSAQYSKIARIAVSARYEKIKTHCFEYCEDAALAKQKSTAKGIEALRVEPNGFLVHDFNHSVTLS